MFIPFRDRDPINIFPIMTVLIMFINLLVFIYELALMADGGLFAFFFAWGMIPYRVTAYPGVFSALTLVTSQFIHAGWMHLISNMLYLWIFGNNVEARLGSLAYLAVYLTCGFAADVAHILVSPASPIPAIGASGAIAGVLGAYIVTYPRNKIRTLVFFGLIRLVNLPASVVLGGWFVLQLFNGVASLGVETQGGGVAYFAHIGGFVAGAFLMGVYNLLTRG